MRRPKNRELTVVGFNKFLFLAVAFYLLSAWSRPRAPLAVG